MTLTFLWPWPGPQQLYTTLTFYILSMEMADFYQAVGDTSFLLWVSANLNKIVIRNSCKLLKNWMKIRYLNLVLLLPLLSIAELEQNFIYTEWQVVASHAAVARSSPLYYARGAQGVVLMRVGGCNQSIGSTVSDAIIRSWLWLTATRSSQLWCFSTLLQVVDNLTHILW